MGALLPCQASAIMSSFVPNDHVKSTVSLAAAQASAPSAKEEYGKPVVVEGMAWLALTEAVSRHCRLRSARS